MITPVDSKKSRLSKSLFKVSLSPELRDNFSLGRVRKIQFRSRAADALTAYLTLGRAASPSGKVAAKMVEWRL